LEAFFPISGYMAPEYASEGQFSIKSDVFSFGVVAPRDHQRKKETTGSIRPEILAIFLGM
jgi:serine/threonine protein kinase